MHFCSNNETLNNPWILNGINHCFFETVPLTIYFGLIVIFGFPIILIRFKTKILSQEKKEKSIFYCMQLLFIITMPLIAVIRLIFQRYILYDKVIYGYMILSAIGNVVSYAIVLILYFQDRYYKFRNVNNVRHCMVLTAFWFLAFINENLQLVSLRSENWWWSLKSNSDKVEFSFWVIKYVLTFCILILGLNAPAMQKSTNILGYSNIQNSIEELNILDDSPTLWSRIKKKIVLVYNSTWPKDSYLLQFQVLLCIGILIVGRVLNVYAPITYKYVVDSLTPSMKKNVSQYEDYQSPPLLESLLNPSRISFRDSKNGLVFRWDLILVFVALRLLQGSGAGSSGILNSLRTQLWIRVQQYSSRRISVHLFAHIHGLSLRWHLSKKTGEVLRIMDRGTDSLQNILNYILFNIVPTLVDILIGIIYFASAFNGYFALIVFGTMVLYLVGTVLVTEWRTKYRRIMNQLDNSKNAKAVDSLINFETVKYYGAEAYEVKKYRDAITDFQSYEWLSLTTLNVLNFVQNLIINVGFLGGALLCAFYICNEKGFTVGDFVLYCTYIIQLNAPLNFFGTYYRYILVLLYSVSSKFRMIQQNFIDMENMFDLLEIKQEIKDTTESQTIFIRKGEVEFKDVCFSYHPELVLFIL